MVQKSRKGDPVQFHFDKVYVELRDRRKLRRFINSVVRKENRDLTGLNYIFCTDKALLRINRKFLDHNFYTDVITFDLSSAPKEILGDIYISADRVRDNAKALRTSFKEELHRVIFHGLMHLCGYNDKTDRQLKIMRSKESSYLALYFERFT